MTFDERQGFDISERGLRFLGGHLGRTQTSPIPAPGGGAGNASQRTTGAPAGGSKLTSNTKGEMIAYRYYESRRDTRTIQLRLPERF